MSHGSRSAVKLHILLLRVVDTLLHALVPAIHSGASPLPLEMDKSQSFVFLGDIALVAVQKKKKAPKPVLEASLQLPLQVLSGINIFVTFCAPNVHGFSEDSPASKGQTFIFSQGILSVKSSIIVLHTRSDNHSPVRCAHLFAF